MLGLFMACACLFGVWYPKIFILLMSIKLCIAVTIREEHFYNTGCERTCQ